jgi:hypothetical protein
MGGGGGGVQGPPPAKVYQSLDPYAANYKSPTGPQLAPGQRAAVEAKSAATMLAPINPDDEEERRRRRSLILGGTDYWGGDGGSSGSSGSAADAGSGSDGNGDY